MTSVLVVGSTAPSPLALTAGLAELTAAGAQVDLVLLNMPGANPYEMGFRMVKRLVPLRYPNGEPFPRWTVPWLLNGLRYRGLVLRLHRMSPGVRTWALVERDVDATMAAAVADVVVALDRFAVYPAWRLARRHGVPAFHGMHAAAEHLLDAMAQHGAPHAGGTP